MQKNELVTVTIEDIGINGEGIGKVDGYTLFIKDAIIGDVVEAKVMKAKKNYGYARLMNILTPSPYRVNARWAANAAVARSRRWSMTASWPSKKTRSGETLCVSEKCRRKCWIRRWSRS